MNRPSQTLGDDLSRPLTAETRPEARGWRGPGYLHCSGDCAAFRRHAELGGGLVEELVIPVGAAGASSRWLHKDRPVIAATVVQPGKRQVSCLSNAGMLDEKLPVN